MTHNEVGSDIKETKEPSKDAAETVSSLSNTARTNYKKKIVSTNHDSQPAAVRVVQVTFNCGTTFSMNLDFCKTILS